MDWSSQQDAAIKAAQHWLKDKSSNIFRLFGYAGTGKTTLAREVASAVGGKVLYGAYTGKAASVMRQKGCNGAKTIHSLIYQLDDDQDSGDNPQFTLDEESAIRDAKLVIIDECSMVDEQVGKDLLSFGVKVLVLGDPAQLPPISGGGFFTEDVTPDVMLTEVHRQAQDNPIVQMSMAIREGKTLSVGNYGDSKIITRKQLTTEEVMASDQIIVGLNKTRQLYNGRIRELLGRTDEMPVRGDRLVCLRNDRKKGIFNGSLWSVDKFKANKKKPNQIDLFLNAEDGDSLRGKAVSVRKEFFTGADTELTWENKRGSQEFTYGYALTCHKSQGSQWNNIVIFDESYAFRENASRWRYTAVTRAAEKLTMIAKE
jgi:exodeoxyribonuclease-5